MSLAPQLLLFINSMQLYLRREGPGCWQQLSSTLNLMSGVSSVVDKSCELLTSILNFLLSRRTYMAIGIFCNSVEGQQKTQRSSLVSVYYSCPGWWVWKGWFRCRCGNLLKSQSCGTQLEAQRHPKSLLRSSIVIASGAPIARRCPQDGCFAVGSDLPRKSWVDPIYY